MIANLYKRFCSVFFAAFLALIAGSSAAQAESPPVVQPVILVSIAPQKFFVDQLAYDLVRTEALIPPSASVETYEPTVQQLTTSSKAVAYLLLGHPSFPFEQVWLERLRRPQLQVVNCSAGMPLISDDPHIWVSPFTASFLADCSARFLKTLLPQQAALIETRLQTLRAQMKSVEEHSDRSLKPLRGKSFIIYHPELGYLAEHYGLRQLGLEHEGKEIGSRSLMEVISTGKTLGIKTILAQPQYSAREAQTVAGELQADVVRIDPLSYNWIDNTQAIIKALADALNYVEPSHQN